MICPTCGKAQLTERPHRHPSVLPRRAAHPDGVLDKSGYSEPGERDREAAVLALDDAIRPLYTTPERSREGAERWLNMIDAHPEAAATLAAYLRGASPQPKEPQTLTPCWFCGRGFGDDYLIAGYDTWDEQRLACLDCDRAIHALRDKGWLQPKEPQSEPSDTHLLPGDVEMQRLGIPTYEEVKEMPDE